MTRVLITAAGAMRRWTVDGQLHGGVPKHLIPVLGEPLLARTVRLLRERGIGDIIVVGPDDDRYRIPGAELHVPTHHVPWLAEPATHDADKFLSSRELWAPDGRTVIVHGDVYLAEDAADAIVGREEPGWCLFARYRRHPRPFHKLETVAFSFGPEDHARMDDVLGMLVSLQDAGDLPRTGTWELYRGMRGDPVQVLARVTRLPHHEMTHGHSVDIAPPTTDMDRPRDHEGLLAHLARTVRTAA